MEFEVKWPKERFGIDVSIQNVSLPDGGAGCWYSVYFDLVLDGALYIPEQLVYVVASVGCLIGSRRMEGGCHVWSGSSENGHTAFAARSSLYYVVVIGG